MKSRYLFLGLSAVGLFLVFRYLLPLVLPFILAYLFTRVLSPVVDGLERKFRWNRKITGVFLVLFCVLAVGGFLIYAGMTLIGQFTALLRKIPVYGQILVQEAQKLCCQCDRLFEWRVGTSFHYLEAGSTRLYENIGNEILPAVSGVALAILKQGAGLAAGVFIFLLSSFLMVSDKSLPGMHKKWRKLAQKLKRTGFAYIRSQMIILFLIASVMTAGLMVMGNEYSLLFGVCLAVFDAFPVVGSGIVLIPWCFFEILCGNWFDAAILATVFVVVTFLREVLEPKLFAKDVGLKPLPVLISVYAGVKLFEIGGFILGPAALTILKTMDDEWKEKGTPS